MFHRFSIQQVARLLTVVSLLLVCKEPAQAQDDLIAIAIRFGTKDMIVQCMGTVPGTMIRNGTVFQSLANAIKTLKAKVKKQPKLKTKLKKQRDLLKLALPACIAARNGPVPTPVATATPLPGGTPLPSPTPDPLAVFDSFGNMTAVGKTFLGVPPALSANIDRGEDVQQFYCIGCHDERRLWHYPELGARIQGDPMYFQVPQDINFQMLADLVAYLNRFRLRAT